MPTTFHAETLEMALIGFEAEHEKIQQRFTEIQTQLTGRCRAITPGA